MLYLSQRARKLAGFAVPAVASAATSSSPTSAYIHLPFCAQKCAYCAFPVVISGRSALPCLDTADHPEPSQAHVDYVNLLCMEIRAVANRWIGLSPFSQPNVPLSTLYLGGGTPSLLHPRLLGKVLSTVREAIGLQSDAEVTCEMDPATFTPRTAAAFRELGVNRASVGAQSFDDSLLAACRRIHTSEDISSAMSALRGAGFDNVSLDLISGLPGQTMDTWRKSLDRALQFKPEHVSAYDLTLEEGTDFGRKYKSGQGPLPAEDLTVDMMKETVAVLRQGGYEHYEVSNFALRDRATASKEPQVSVVSKRPRRCPTSMFRSRHNLAYWQNKPFYAFGLGATSLLDGYRFARPRRLPDYKTYVQNVDRIAGSIQKRDGFEVAAHSAMFSALYPHVKPQSSVEELEDYLVNSFRLLVEGVSFMDVLERFGSVAKHRLVSAIKKHSHLVDKGFIEIVGTESDAMGAVRLTEEGALIENTVLSTLMQEAVWQYSTEVISDTT